MIFAVEMNNGQYMTPADAYASLSQYFQGSYFTGKLAPVPVNFTPFTAVIDLETMKVIGRSTYFRTLTLQQIQNLANQAASN